MDLKKEHHIPDQRRVSIEPLRFAAHSLTFIVSRCNMKSNDQMEDDLFKI